LSYLQGNYGDSLSYYQEAIDIKKILLTRI
jgi:hypothetical protein